MRKWLVNLTGILTISSSALPLTGCTFNFYVSSVKKKIAINLANQTSSIIKSLIAAKNLNSNTQATINDALSIAGTPIIQNPTSEKEINNWNDFSSDWGYEGKIETKGFDNNSFIVNSKDGERTNQINNLKSVNNIFQYLTYAEAINLIDNKTIYSLLLDKSSPGRPIMKQLLQSLKDKTLDEPWNQLVSNLIDDYQGNFLTPITNVLNELVNGWNEVTNPNDLKTYMEEWKDPTGIPYSQWINSNGEWTLGAKYYQEWKSNDIVLYRAGVFINYLFKKIGIDNPNDTSIKKRGYLGEIILSNLGDPLPALLPYLSLLLTNPKYLFLIIIGILPIIKELIFQADDLTHGIKKLTFGNHYPTDKTNNSYNLKTVFTYLKDLIEDKTIIERHTWKEKTYEWTRLQKIVNDKILSSPFLYDVKIIGSPLPVMLNNALGNSSRYSLIDTIGNFLTGNVFKPIFNIIYDIVEKMNDQFQGSDGIELDLTKLKDLLIGDNGLLIMLKDVADTIRDIIKPNGYYDENDEITDEQLGKLYQSLGGQLPINGSIPSEFSENSILWKLKIELSNKESELTKLIQIIVRNDQYQGINSIISTWIKENYTDYLSPSYPKSEITNVKYQISEKNNQSIINISYDFYYEINSIKYHFFIRGITVDDKENSLGTHNFKFKEIYQI